MDTNESNVSGRASYTEDERRELIKEYHASESTQAAFCREWNINPKTLARWLKIEREEADISFCEVELPADPPEADDLTICLPNGVQVILKCALHKQLGTVLREAAGCLD